MYSSASWEAGWNVPSLLPRSTKTSPVGELGTELKSVPARARSSRPSPLKSPATMATGTNPLRRATWGLESAIAVAQQNLHAIGAGDGQV